MTNSIHSIVVKWIASLLIIIIILCFASPCITPAAEQSSTMNPSELYAKSAVLMDGDSGRVLFGKCETLPLPNASTTKIMTCILALEHVREKETVKASAYAASQPKVHLGMTEGEEFALKDLLYGLMLESFNDCAVAIAESIGGDVKGFAKLMNEKAAEIGCEDTYFITPNGLDAKDKKGEHHTTAVDLARIMRYCVMESAKAEEFKKITTTPSYQFTNLSGQRTYSCYNHNALLNQMEGVLSGKTGFTGNAGYCYICIVQNKDRIYIVALLACGWPNNRSYKWQDTKKLLTYGMEQYEKETPELSWMDSGRLKPIEVIGGTPEQYGQKVWLTPTVKEHMNHHSILVKRDEQIQIVYQIPKQLEAPVQKGTKIGSVYYKIGREIIQSYEVTAENNVSEKEFSWYIQQIIENWMLFS